MAGEGTPTANPGGDEPGSRNPLAFAASENIQSALQKVTAERPEEVFGMLSVSGVGDPLLHKMEAQHITQALDLTLKQSQWQYELGRAKETNTVADRNATRRYIFASFVVVILLVMLVLFLFQAKPEVLVPLISGITGLASGFIGGFGLGKQQSK